MVKRTFILLLLALSAMTLLYVVARRKENRAVQRPALVLGTMSGWPPYVSVNQQGEYEGFDIDVAHIIANKMNSQLVIKDMDTVALLGALDQNKVDFLMTGLCITNERLKRIAMVHYTGEPIDS